MIKKAEISRRKFYKYFRNKKELFVEVAKEVSKEIIQIVDSLLQQQENPAARLACGLEIVATGEYAGIGNASMEAEFQDLTNSERIAVVVDLAPGGKFKSLQHVKIFNAENPFL